MSQVETFEKYWDPWDPATKVSWFSVHDSGQTMLLMVYTVDFENLIVLSV